jgi:hypothetical protein
MSSETHEQEQKSSSIGVETRGAVKAELDLILAAPAFSQSTRCKGFLRHVVLTALAGNTDQLKERLIGIAVFGRPNDFNTGGDSIVRVTANEVRKRLSQHYQESKAAHPVEIDLPRGTYVPEFRFHPVQQSAAERGRSAIDFAVRENDVGNASPVNGLLSSVSHSELPAANPSEVAIIAASGKGSTRTALIAASSLVLLIAVAAITYGIFRGREKKPVADIWSPFQNAKTPILLALGTHDISDPSPQSSHGKDDFYNLVLHREIVPIDDVEVLTSIEKLLAKRGIPYRVTAAEKVTLPDLQKQPVVLVGAAGNQWTLRLTQGLRYRIALDWPSGPNQAPIASIVDSDDPGGVWKLDFAVPMDRWKHDYAIITRENDASIGVPVLVIAGLGNFGTLAASEAIASDALAQKLTHDGPCDGKPNFEAVIGTDITGAHAGPPQILRETCW